jgi:serine protease SohB
MAPKKSSSRFLDRLVPKRFRSVPVVPVVRLSGVIGISTPLKPGLTLAGLARVLDRAFTFRKARAVALVINSPGGSAVQSHLIHERIRQLAAEHRLPVIAFVEDVGASGGYMIACAADEIVCDPSSILGSIGVVGSTFGFEKAIKKLGVERRIYTAGKNKAMLDPFLPENPEDVKKLKAIQQQIHDLFIALVKARRGKKLKGPESALFSGEYWVGSKAVELGLADRLGEIRAVLREKFGEKVVTPLIAERGWFGRKVPGVGSQFESLLPQPGLADDILSTLEARAIWARYGF